MIPFAAEAKILTKQNHQARIGEEVKLIEEKIGKAIGEATSKGFSYVKVEIADEYNALKKVLPDPLDESIDTVNGRMKILGYHSQYCKSYWHDAGYFFVSWGDGFGNVRKLAFDNLCEECKKCATRPTWSSDGNYTYKDEPKEGA